MGLWPLVFATSGFLAPSPSLEIDYRDFQGLTVSHDGVPLITGSSFQLYEPNWTRGIYSSAWKPVVIDRSRPDRILVTFTADEGRFRGTQTFTKLGDGVRGEFEFRWLGTRRVMLEHSASFLWAPVLQPAQATVDGRLAGVMGTANPTSPQMEPRIIGVGEQSFAWDAPYAAARIGISGVRLTAFDARNYNQPWAEGKEVVWLGHTNQAMEPNSTLRYTIEWQFAPKRLSVPAAQTLEPDWTSLPAAERARSTDWPLIPQPKESRPGTGTWPLPGSLEFTGPLGSSHLGQRFAKVVQARWDGPVPANLGQIQIQLDSTLPAEGYRLQVTESGPVLHAKDALGAGHAVTTLAQLVRPAGGRLVVPAVTIRDWPSVSWRGVHMFVGPQALGMQTDLMDRYFAPLRLNHVVLQCERTDWSSQPGIRSGWTMERDDLKTLFERYRERQIEPIPLIQSMGHMGWFFQNKQNLDVALNPQVPFTLDPRKEESRRRLRAIWDEAIALLKPKTIHFGMDEVDMRGVQHDPFMSTRLWARHVPWLMAYAKEKRVNAMVWGDMMLAPGEANDAMNGHSGPVAAQRRAALSPGTYVADWHYAANPDPAVYKSLALWKKAGMRPIASTWDRPENIYGFTHAAIQQGAGVLTTTWAGYESNELAMAQNFPQIAAYLLMAEYAWSGRKERPGALPYDYLAVARRMVYGTPSPTQSRPGVTIRGTETASIGSFSLGKMEPVAMVNTLIAGGDRRPHRLVVKADAQARKVVLALGVETFLKEGQVLADVKATTESGTEVRFPVLYGQHVRAARDTRSTFLTESDASVSAFTLVMPHELAGQRLATLEIEAKEPRAGLTLRGVTILP
ncbi:MAG TPA: glycoside hydrolase family 20 zincin-like fold domain-containing protein [Fimbriimonadaceae bacterium]|mgnify:CR=1 FL=1|nr:hypothetical protein [Armatimonadota bacterium]HRD30226.1 glycoside hydrolase family 20 zincin-like fold domain-containing protein [Fimbriimonadaceae bacterium]HRE94513.1 glycoside hydrolase family 20 zincin-like fold domain-containing protein [Fimbriimonadaceae bacterium]HRI73521.1 glycoside hydrolase family 20 zincin-like fold domain-containing protein [Fimbriimonadaceae bacterium]